MTSVVMLFIRFVLRIPLRMSEDKLLIGDDAIHGEEAYSIMDAYPIGPGRSLLYGDTIRNRVSGDGELGIVQGTKPKNGESLESAPVSGEKS